jgi:hypothetical protein
MEKDGEVKEEVNKNDLPVVSSDDTSKKSKKEFKWTPKRLEAFEKMRAGLETKNELTKKLKEEKSKKEKDDLKKRVREIMSFTSAAKDLKNTKMDADSASEENSSESEQEEKKDKKVIKKKKEPEVKFKKRSKKEVASSSEEESDKQDSDSGEEERAYLSRKKQEKLRKSKEKSGKAVKTTPLYNPMDRFILL